MPDTFVADLTGLLDLGSWQKKIPGLRVIVRDEPLHPRYRKRATEREKQLGRRYQLIAINTTVGQIAWLDARHRSHVHVENDVKQAKDLGLNRWPSRHWAINVAWTQIVALAANLLACLRHLALEGEQPPGPSMTRAPQPGAPRKRLDRPRSFRERNPLAGPRRQINKRSHMPRKRRRRTGRPTSSFQPRAAIGPDRSLASTPDGKFRYVEVGVAGGVDGFRVKPDGTLARIVTLTGLSGLEGIAVT